MEPRTRIDQKTGMAATFSILSAVGSYIAICAGHPGWALLLSIISIPLGLLGLIISASPRVKGGILSIFAMVLGIVGVVVSLLAVAGAIVF